MDPCKEKIFRDYHFYACRRHAWKNGYCKQHHPDTVAERRKKSEERYAKNKENDPLFQLVNLKEEYAILEQRIDKAKEILAMGHTQRERDAYAALTSLACTNIDIKTKGDEKI